MPESKDIFLKVITELNKKNVLDEFILIGSWCLLIYKDYFNNAPEISMVRTHDIDLMIPNPPKIKNSVDISKLLKELGFEIFIDRMSGYSKYIQKDADVEFLIPEKGKGQEKPYEIKKLNINAQGLRFLTLLQDYTFIYDYQGIKIKLPIPEVYVLHKYIIANRRKNEDKKEKDLYTATLIGEYMINFESNKNRLIEIYNSLPVKWQEYIKKSVKVKSKILFDLLQ